MSEYFRRVIVKFFLKKKLISAKIATSLINWRHSGFSVDASVHIHAGSSKTREALSQYIARPPLSLKKISIEENGEATVISYTSDNEFFRGKIESFSVTRFLLELTQHIPPRGSQVYPAIWALCFKNQGQVAGHAPCDAARPCRMASRTAHRRGSIQLRLTDSPGYGRTPDD